MKYKLKFNLLPNEAGYGADINYGYKLPVTENSRTKTDTRYIDSYNQATPLWVSNKGRYIWSNAGYMVKWNKGTAVCYSEKSEIKLYDGYKNLRGAYLAASKAHFPFDGKHPVLDLSNPKSAEWFKATADRLMNEYGVDGFKQDAGDAYFYKDSDRTFRPGTDANEQSYLWAETAREYEFNELRACFKGGGWGVTQRLADKTHSWDRNGLNTLIPNALLQGLSGYPYSCPDMIGGGEISSFKRKNGDTFSIDKAENEFDTELLIRWCQCSALMPMMQYSFAIWKMENDTAREVCISCAELHQKYADTIISLAQNASKTGEPIIRSLEYQYPNQGYEKANDMFMLGESILVSPVLKKGDRQKTLRLPNGKWRYVPNKKVYIGGEIITVDAPLDVLPIFEKTAD